MNDIIQRYRALPLGFMPGISTQEWSALETTLACHLPPDLAALYRDHNGTRRRPGDGVRFQLMPADEVKEVQRTIAKPLQLDTWGIRLFWTNDESDYAGIYVTTPLVGRVCLLSHEEADLTPRWRTVRAFVEQVLAGAEQATEVTGLDRDYYRWYGPPENDRPAQNREDVVADWQAAQALRPRYAAAIANEADRIHFAWCIMALTPFEETHTLLEFLQEDSDEILEKACVLLGRRAYEPAVPLLVEVAERGAAAWPHAMMGSLAATGAQAAITALAVMGLPSARDGLVHLLTVLPTEAVHWRQHVTALLGERVGNESHNGHG